MSMIYEGRCFACEATTPLTTDGYLAVFVDHAPEDYRHPENPNLAILAHPGEQLTLEELGLNYRSAALSGRLVNVDCVFCKDCGRTFEIRTLTAGFVHAFGCLPVIILAAIVGAIGAIQSKSLLSGFLWSWISLVPLSWVLGTFVYHFVRWKHSDRAKEVDTLRRCPHCKGRRYEVPGALRGKIPCLACGERAVTFRSVGIS